jgi:hypothetical protein
MVVKASEKFNQGNYPYKYLFACLTFSAQPTQSALEISIFHPSPFEKQFLGIKSKRLRYEARKKQLRDLASLHLHPWQLKNSVHFDLINN